MRFDASPTVFSGRFETSPAMVRHALEIDRQLFASDMDAVAAALPNHGLLASVDEHVPPPEGGVPLAQR
jgi:hypothetical protein